MGGRVGVRVGIMVAVLRAVLASMGFCHPALNLSPYPSSYPHTNTDPIDNCNPEHKSTDIACGLLFPYALCKMVLVREGEMALTWYGDQPEVLPPLLPLSSPGRLGLGLGLTDSDPNSPG